MTDREEREKVIEVLKNMLDWMEAANMISSKPERIEAVKYAIASIKTDLKYDLLYEGTLEEEPAEYKEPTVSLGAYKQVAWERDIAIEQLHELGYEFGQKIESTTKNDLSSGLKNGSPIIDWNNCHTSEQLDSISTTKNDLGVDCVDRQATLDAIIKRLGISNESYLLPAEKTIYQQIKDMPSVTPQEPILDQITEIIEPLRHLPIGEMSDIEWDILRVIDKYKAETER